MPPQSRNTFRQLLFAGSSLAASVVLLSCNPPNYPTKPMS
jgi:hypothetical protein